MKAIATVDWNAPRPEGAKSYLVTDKTVTCSDGTSCDIDWNAPMEDRRYYAWDGQTLWGPDDS